ncbi:MAG: serine/threonine-protein phosphatase [Clostridia bacterium]|nr:serine/threonine-protein phosphatase [Clostridia bacterium]
MFSSGKTDIGLRRQVNQDTFAAERFAPDAELFVVCDGMGGVQGGAEASRLACEAFCAVMRHALPDIMTQVECVCSDTEAIAAHKDRLCNCIPDMLTEAADAANRAVYEAAMADESLKGMGTTLVALFVWGSYACGINIGDSRLYALTGQGIRQLSHDHSYVQYLIDLGKLTPEEARTSTNRNIITRAVGTAPALEADIVAVDAGLVGQATFLLCSDGLSGMITDAEMAAIVRGADSLDAAVDALIAAANAAGGSDNITVVLCR